MKYQSNYTYQDGVSRFYIVYNKNTFVGQSQCHPEDMDFESERVGLTIAEARANIALMRHIRDNEIKPQLKILKHLYDTTSFSTKHNPKSHETKMLRRMIKDLENELATTNNAIADERKFVKDYIDGKEKLYQRIRDKNK